MFKYQNEFHVNKWEFDKITAKTLNTEWIPPITMIGHSTRRRLRKFAQDIHDVTGSTAIIRETKKFSSKTVGAEKWSIK